LHYTPPEWTMLDVATREERAAHVRIARPGLAERLARALDSGSIVLTAGAGCGKTIALEQALALRPAPSVWLRCRPTDRDPGTLLRRLVQMIAEVAPGAVDLLAERLAMAQEQVDARAAAAQLVDELDRLLPTQIVAAFDDAEALADSPGAVSLVGDLIAADSPVLRVAVATRTGLPLRLAKLRSSGRVAELGAGDLAFTAEECAELVLATGKPDADAESLFAATEGWPLGAALGAVHADVPSLRGAASRTRLFEFLAEEALDLLPAALREAVVDSSITHELDAECAAALGLPEDFAEQLTTVGLPIRSGDGARPWVAYHPLVREFLLDRLERERPPEAQRDLHLRVAPALVAAGRGEEAIEHWLSAESWDDAVTGITSTGPGLLSTSPETVERWLAALPAAARRERACLLLQGALDWAGGRQAQAVTRLREATVSYTDAGDVIGMWLARFALADPLFATGGLEEVVILAEGFDDEPALAAGFTPPAVAVYAAGALAALGRAHECEELSRRIVEQPNSAPVLALREVWQCYAHLLEGRFGELVPAAEGAIREFKRADPFNRLAVVSAMLPLVLADQGRDAEALARWDDVEERARDAHSNAMVKVSLVWQALLHARRGELADAEEPLARASEHTSVGWREWVTELARARVAALAGDAPAAVAACERGLAIAKTAPLSERFQAAVEAAPVLFHGGVPAAARMLVEGSLELCENRAPGERGRYSRALLHGLRAWLADTEGDRVAADKALCAMWESAGPNAADVIRREWNLLEGPLSRGLEAEALDPNAVVAAIEAAWPGGTALVPLTVHPNPRVRRAAVAPAAVSGHRALVPRLAELADDRDPDVAATARAATERLRAHPPPLVIGVLGGFTLKRGSWEVEDSAWDRRVAERLVHYLLVKRGSLVPDDLLLEAFWPDTAHESARRSLKVAVSCARAVLDVPDAPSAIVSTQGTLGLRLREGDSVDVDLFEHAAQEGLAAEGAERRRLLDHAAALWTGEPLPQERYSDWAIAWRESLIARYADVLRGLVAACHEDGDDAAATQAARSLVEVDPLDESAHRDLIRAYARSGRRAHALRQYLVCRRRLVDELGMEPGRETSDLQRRILAGEPV
jgi:ATP/maltotriose-dependent transcriptional regulator MalT/DNA-binding SARP family transcriptional activator